MGRKSIFVWGLSVEAEVRGEEGIMMVVPVRIIHYKRVWRLRICGWWQVARTGERYGDKGAEG